MQRKKPPNFHALPKAWKGVGKGLDQVIHLETKDKTGQFYPDIVLADLGPVQKARFAPEKVVRDCEIIAHAVQKDPDSLRKVLDVVTRHDAGSDEIEGAYSILEKAGLTERQMIEAGGGLLWLLVLAVVLASCEHCHASHPAH